MAPSPESPSRPSAAPEEAEPSTAPAEAPPPELSRGRRRLFGLVAVVLGLLFVVAVGEIVVRAQCEIDADGNWHYRGRKRIISPRHLPQESIRRSVEKYEFEGKSSFTWDPLVGWLYRPDLDDPQHHVNEQGIRLAVGDARTVPAQPPAGRLRVAAFGDSYTFGSQVTHEQSWPQVMAAELAAAGRPAEVLNFGVPGHGTGQAYLRWQTAGQDFHPDVVLFGFTAENLYRMVNIGRWFYTGSPVDFFSKPRFVPEGDGLRLLNQPCVPPAELPEWYHTFDQNPLAPHEYHYDPADYEAHWYNHSRFLSMMIDSCYRKHHRWVERPELYDPEGEIVSLWRAIVGRFRREVEAAGGRFVVVHLPRSRGMKQIDAGEPLYYAEFLALVKEEFETVCPQRRMLERQKEGESIKDSFFRKHYNPFGNRVVGEHVARQLRDRDLLPAPAAREPVSDPPGA